MRTLAIALDLEGVLAETHAATAERSDVLTEDNCPPQHYDFGDRELLDEYMHVSHNLWKDNWDDIPAIPQPKGWDVGWVTERLHNVHSVDIITSRIGVKDSIEKWLLKNNIAHDNLYITDEVEDDKTEYGDWEVLVDDATHNIEHALDAGRLAFIHDRPYNQDWACPEEHHGRLRRVSTVTDAMRLLCDPGFVGGIQTL